MKRVRLRLSVVAMLALLPAAAPAQMLRLESLSGQARLERGGATSALAAGAELREADVLTLSADARAALRFARHGILELGPGSQLSVERAPFASYADDLRSVFRLRQGYLRVIWKQPALNTSWPLFVYLGNHRVSLGSGEYFFDKQADREMACAAEGELAVAASGRVETDSLEPEACYRLVAGAAPQALARTPEDWVAVRQQYALAATGQDPPPATVAAMTPPAQPSPRAVPPPPAPAPAPAIERTAPPLPPPAPVPVDPPPSVVQQPPPRAVAPPPPIVSPPPAAAPRPAPATPAGEAVSVIGEWALNLASFPERDTADKQVQRVRGAGYPAVVRTAEVKGRTWYRVQIPGLASADEARQMAEELKKIGFTESWVFRQP